MKLIASNVKFMGGKKCWKKNCIVSGFANKTLYRAGAKFCLIFWVTFFCTFFPITMLDVISIFYSYSSIDDNDNDYNDNNDDDDNVHQHRVQWHKKEKFQNLQTITIKVNEKKK